MLALGIPNKTSVEWKNGRMKASLEKILFWNEISRKKYSLEKQLEINHTAGSVLANDGSALVGILLWPRRYSSFGASQNYLLKRTSPETRPPFTVLTSL